MEEWIYKSKSPTSTTHYEAMFYWEIWNFDQKKSLSIKDKKLTWNDSCFWLWINLRPSTSHWSRSFVFRSFSNSRLREFNSTDRVCPLLNWNSNCFPNCSTRFSNSDPDYHGVQDKKASYWTFLFQRETGVLLLAWHLCFSIMIFKSVRLVGFPVVRPIQPIRLRKEVIYDYGPVSNCPLG